MPPIFRPQATQADPRREVRQQRGVAAVGSRAHPGAGLPARGVLPRVGGRLGFGFCTWAKTSICLSLLKLSLKNQEGEYKHSLNPNGRTSHYICLALYELPCWWFGWEVWRLGPNKNQGDQPQPANPSQMAVQPLDRDIPGCGGSSESLR